MIYKQDYYGYVYLWFDRKRMKFCIGSHHGAVEDNYITSSKYMLQAYERRPEDFKMRVLEYNTASKDYKETQKLEQKALDHIKEYELGNRYYNLKKWATGGNGMAGATWYNNGVTMRLLFETATIPAGYVKGYNPNIVTTNNWIWYYNPKDITDDIHLPHTVIPPEGWVKGRPNMPCTGFWFKDPDSADQSRFKDIDDVPYGWVRGRYDGGTIGTKWAHNNDDTSASMLILEGEDLPDGWSYGMTHKGTGKSYYNPSTNIEIKLLENDEVPEGFTAGGKPKGINKQDKFGKMTKQEFSDYCSGRTQRSIRMVTNYRNKYRDSTNNNLE